MTVIIFDLDGTLADTSGDLLAAANAVFVTEGHEAPLTSADRTTALLGGFAMLNLGAERLDLDSAFVDAGYPKLLQHYEERVADHTVFYQGMGEMIQGLRNQGYKTAICTNKPIHLAENLIQELGYTEIFDTIVGVNSIPERKPDPAPIYLTLDRLNARGAQAILVGDTSTDYNAAKNAGIDIVLVDFEDTKIGETHPDAPLVRSVDALNTYLHNWAKA